MAALPPLGVHVVVLDLLVKLGRLGRMDHTLGGDTAARPAGLAAGLSVLHCNLSLGARQDIRTAAPDCRVAGERASDSTEAGRKRLRVLVLIAAYSAGLFSGGQLALRFKHISVSFIVWLSVEGIAQS